MTKKLLLKIYITTAAMVLIGGSVLSQVGIGTTSPDTSALLQIEDGNGDKGILIPNVALTSTMVSAPISPAPATSLLVYNTATAGSGNTAVTPGYYWWDGIQWQSMQGAGEKWDLLGNLGTDASTNFVGTLDGEALTFRTNNVQRFRVANNNQVHAMANGTRLRPFYSWDADQTMGLWRPGTSQMNMSINGYDFFNANANVGGGSDLEWTFNPVGDDMNLRVETDNNANSFFVSGEEDNVGLGTNSPDPSSQLDMADINKGLLVNRVALTATNVAAPVTAPAEGLLIYNTSSASSGSTEVIPGFYYWSGTEWIAMGGTGGRDWSLEGNAGTNAGTNFLGTTDATSLVVRTNDTNRMYVDAAGTLGVAALPYTNAAMRVSNAAQPFGIYAETSGTGVAVYGEDTGTGLGVYGTSANNHGIFGITDYTGGAFLIGGMIGWGSGFNGANGMLAVADKQATSSSNMGIRAVSGSTTSISSNEILNVGVNTNATDLALYALTEGPITNGVDVEAARFQTNYTGVAIDPDSRDPRAELAGFTNNSLASGGGTTYYGAFLYSGGSNSNSSFAYAGARHNGTNYKIIGTGTVSTIVEGASRQDKARVMFAPEAPEVLLEDYGTAQLQNGVAQVNIDPILANNILVSNDHPLKVFIQLEGECNGIYVSNKSANGFTVKELKKGTSNTKFSWHIVANRKDVTGRNAEESSIFANLRFPEAPTKIQPKEGVANTIQANEDPKTKVILPTKNN